MKSLLYLMHVHWGWIKQRPQFLAEGLSASFNVVVVYEKVFNRESAKEYRRNSPLCHIELRRLPFNRYRTVYKLNCFFHRLRLIPILIKADVVWITHPYMLSWVNNNSYLASKLLIYDCMDDYLEAPELSKGSRVHLASLERKLVLRANQIFASSERLRENLLLRYQISEEKIKTVNNALHIYETTPSDISSNLRKIYVSIKSKEKKTILYIGTIAEWVDFNLLKSVSEQLADTEFHFVGPLVCKRVEARGFYFHSPVQHHEIPQLMTFADALIMPFKLNSFTEGVNPVKLYEYISSGKPVIANKYSESNTFNEFVYLYSDAQELFTFLKKLGNENLPAKGSALTRSRFVESNTWTARAREIQSCISASLE